MNKEENTYYKNSPKFGRKGPSKLREERKSEEGFQKYRSDRGAGCIDYGCIDIDQYADTGTDHKYP